MPLPIVWRNVCRLAVFIAVCLKRPNEAWANLRSIRAYPTVWAFLDQQTADRVSEKQQKTMQIDNH